MSKLKSPLSDIALAMFFPHNGIDFGRPGMLYGVALNFLGKATKFKKNKKNKKDKSVFKCLILSKMFNWSYFTLSIEA